MNRTARTLALGMTRRASDRARGDAPAMTRFSSNKASQIMPNVAHLPCVRNTAQLQNEDGEFYFLDGWSDPDGPDILV